MPIEKNRKRHSLKIPIPGETQYAFYIWITDEISFVRQDGIHQEIRLSMRNDPGASTRSVNVNEIDVGGSTPLNVEEIKNAAHKENQGIGQEADWSFLTAPKTHLQTHDVEIKARKTDGSESSAYTLTIRKIDRFYVKDAAGIGQEGYWALDHRDDEDQIDFANPDAVYNKNVGSLRLDWFQTVVKPAEELYMLVVFETTPRIQAFRIAAIPMNKLGSPSGHVYFNKDVTVNGNLWDAYGATQLKIASDTHVAMTHCKFHEDATLSTSPGKVYYCNTKKSLFDSVEVAGGTNEIFDYTFFNFSGKIVYDNFGNKIDFSSATPTATLEKPWVTSPISVAAVGPDGGLYSYVEDSENLLNTFGGARISDAHWTAWGALSQPKVGTAGPGESDTQYVGAIGGVVTTSFNQKILVYSNNGSLDSLSLETVSGTYSANNGIPSSGFSWFGYSGGYDGFTGWYGASYLNLRAYYSFGTTASDSILKVTDYVGPGPLDFSDSVETPYGTRSGESNGATQLFVANGKTHIHQFWVTSETKIYRDKTDYTTTLCTALGISDAFNILAILLDVKKADVDKLK